MVFHRRLNDSKSPQDSRTLLSILAVFNTHLAKIFYTNVSRWFLTGVSIDSKSPQVYRTLLSILADLNNAVVWIVSSPFQVLQSL